MTSAYFACMSHRLTAWLASLRSLGRPSHGQPEWLSSSLLLGRVAACDYAICYVGMKCDVTLSSAQGLLSRRCRRGSVDLMLYPVETPERRVKRVLARARDKEHQEPAHDAYIPVK